jgi:hypothetical protein
MRHRLSGAIRNNSHGVHIEAQGAREDLERFAAALERQRPALAVLEHISFSEIPIVDEAAGFLIADSEEAGARGADVTVDTAACPACIAEVLDPAERRFGYGLTNCTDCGPRFSIIRRVPYDRRNTTMAAFAMCEDCGREYADPLDRPRARAPEQLAFFGADGDGGQGVELVALGDLFQDRLDNAPNAIKGNLASRIGRDCIFNVLFPRASRKNKKEENKPY